MGPSIGRGAGDPDAAASSGDRAALPPGRLKWGTAASARPEGNATGAPETGASAWRGPCGPRASSPAIPRATVRQSRCLTVQPGESHSARNPRSPVPCVNAALEAGRKTSQWPSLSRWETWPRVGLSPGLP